MEGKVVGSIGAFRQQNIHCRTAELGYYLAEAYWGRGIMTDAVRQLCELIFGRTDILRIYAEPFAHNTGSRRVLEKAEFAFEGILKSNACKNGKVMDMAMYARRKEEGCQIRRLGPEGLGAALDLSWQVFLEFEAPEYTQEGIDFFRRTLDDASWTQNLDYYGAYVGDTLVGTLCMRQPQHIGGFFVDARYQRRGIGRALFDAMRADYERQVFTVNAAPYGVEIYRHLGFVPTGPEQTVNGVRFTPMRYEKESESEGKV